MMACILPTRPCPTISPPSSFPGFNPSSSAFHKNPQYGEALVQNLTLNTKSPTQQTPGFPRGKQLPPKTGVIKMLIAQGAPNLGHCSLVAKRWNFLRNQGLSAQQIYAKQEPIGNQALESISDTDVGLTAQQVHTRQGLTL
eukprot:1157880-Pelagomonas_calceolata.AAC.2